MAQEVVNGAALMCSMGLAPSTLIVLPTNKTLAGNMLAATIMDHIPITNIPPFGMCNSTSNRRCFSLWRKLEYSEMPADLLKMINSIFGIWPSNNASILPIIQVIFASGQVSWMLRTTASTWQVSPMADRRRMQIFLGGG